MRITKSWLKDTVSRLVESQAKLCALARQGDEFLTEEFKRRHPHFIGSPPNNPMETLRQLLYDDLKRVIPDVLTD